MSDTRPYRPSNGSEGDSFMAHFCERCIRDRAARQGDYANGCDILCCSLAFGIDHELYPKEWIQDEDGSNPRCTAFMDEGDADDTPPQPEPDPAQIVLIADPTEDIAGIVPAPPQRIEVPV